MIKRVAMQACVCCVHPFDTPRFCIITESYRAANSHNEVMDMAKDDVTIYENGETVQENSTTICDSDITVTDGGATVPDNQPADGDEGTVCIENGAILLDTYRIESDAIEGGMGRVWRVHHTGWNVDLAMKQPKAALFQSQHQKDNFIHECEAWIGLGLHPHIVSCYYVREINGIPTIFSEWMDGGSLKDAIESGSLYHGSEAEQQERLLDIAIQFARGLHYAHECRDEDGQPMGLIHQDVKPDNLLLTKAGEAKVADFGISKARALLTVLEGSEKELAAYADSGGTMYAASGGYTPAYCSMEQMNGLRLTRRTDIYSWAVSVMEMYLGDRPWANGIIAGAACESYFPEARVALSDSMKVLLTECLNEDEAQRPHDFSVIEEKLLAIYKAEIGNDYPRPVPKAAADTADSLNNRALSFLDLGKPEEAERCWEKALERDARHVRSVYNHCLFDWRSGDIDDQTARLRLESAINRSAVPQEYAEYLFLLDSERNAEQIKSNRREVVPLCGPFPNPAISPDGNLVYESCFNDSTVGIWDVKQRCRVGSLQNSNMDNIRMLLLSPNGVFLAVTNMTGTVNLWNMLSRQFVGTLTQYTERETKFWTETGPYSVTYHHTVLAMAFTTDGRLLLTAGADGTIFLWDTNTARGIWAVESQADMFSAVCISHNGMLAATGTNDGTIKVWELGTGKLLRSIHGMTGEINALCFCSNDDTLLAASNVDFIARWNLADGRRINERTSGLSVRITDFSATGTLAISSDGQVFQTADGRCLYTYPDTEVACFASEESYVLTADKSTVWAVWPCPHEPGPRAPWHLSDISSVALSLEREAGFAALIEKARQALDERDVAAATRYIEQMRAIPGAGAQPTYMSLNRDIGRFCRADSIESILPVELAENGDSTRKECFSRKTGDKCTIITGMSYSKNNVEVFDADYEKAVVCTLRSSKQLLDAVLSADGSFAVTGGSDRHVKVWSIPQGKCIKTLKGHSDTINRIFLSADDASVLSGGSDMTVRLWAIEKGQCTMTFQCGNMNGISSVALSPDKRLAAAGSYDGHILIWDTVTGQCVKSLSIDGKVEDILFSHDSKRLWVCCTKHLFDSTLMLWDMRNCNAMHEFKFKSTGNCRLWMSAAGTRTVVSDGYNTYAYTLDYRYVFPGWSDWDEDALPYLEIFLTIHPNWTEVDFGGLIAELQNRGYGWIKPEGVREKLGKLSKSR